MTQTWATNIFLLLYTVGPLFFKPITISFFFLCSTRRTYQCIFFSKPFKGWYVSAALHIHPRPLPLPHLLSHLTHLSIISVHSPSSMANPVPWPPQAGQLQLWPAVRRLRQRLSVTPTGSQWCLAVVLSREWKVQSSRRGGEALTPWLLPELALSRAKVSREGLSSALPPQLQVTIAIVVIAAIRADDTIIVPFSAPALPGLCTGSQFIKALAFLFLMTWLP